MAEELKAARGRLEAALAEAIASWGGIPRDHTNVLVKFDDLRLLLRTPPSMRDEGWQDIATAPKDGKPLLGFSRIGDHNVTRVLSWDEEDEAWICSGSGSPYDPTHWRPLPAPPGAEPIMRDDGVIEAAREELRVLMLEQPTTGRRETYSDGFAMGLSHAIHRIDAAQPKGRDDERAVRSNGARSKTPRRNEPRAAGKALSHRPAGRIATRTRQGHNQ